MKSDDEFARRHPPRIAPGVQPVRLLPVAQSDLSMATDSETMQTLLRPPQYGYLRLTIGKIIHWHFRLFRSKRQAQPVLEQICGMPLLVLPGVLNPKLMRTGEFFASQLSPAVIPGDAEVLDMGTGSGVCAIAAARLARRVVAVDIDQTAVRCARLNVLLNQVDGKVEVVSGDLFAPVTGRRFDLSCSIRRSCAARRDTMQIEPGGRWTCLSGSRPVSTTTCAPADAPWCCSPHTVMRRLSPGVSAPRFQGRRCRRARLRQ